MGKVTLIEKEEKLNLKEIDLSMIFMILDEYYMIVRILNRYTLVNLSSGNEWDNSANYHGYTVNKAISELINEDVGAKYIGYCDIDLTQIGG